MSEVKNYNPDILDKECRCLFCNEKFKVRDIVFFIAAPKEGDFYDKTFEDSANMYKGLEFMEAPYRVPIDWTSDPETCIKNCDAYGIPEAVEGPLKLPDGYVSQGGSDSFGFSGLFGTSQENIAEVREEDGNIIGETTIRVCPRCHMTLLEGFTSEPVIRVGLLGGQRSGKTTYMVAACKYLEKRFAGTGDQDVNLGRVRFTPESRDLIDHYCDYGIRPTKKIETSIEKKDPPVLPVIMRITPNDRENYGPFILILQDIPGEYMNPNSEDEQLLAYSGIGKSTDLIMFIDSNHFAVTRQKNMEVNADWKYGEYCMDDFRDLFENYDTLGKRINADELKSIQVTIAKMDLLIEADPRLKVAAFNESGDSYHKGTISEKRLNKVSRQVSSLLTTKKEFGGYGAGDLVSRIANPVKATKYTRLMYTAVASKDLPGNDDHFDNSGVDVHFEYSMNVLEPLLNVFVSHKLLPFVKEPYIIQNA